MKRERKMCLGWIIFISTSNYAYEYEIDRVCRVEVQYL